MFEKLKKKITGISTPFGGVSWENIKPNENIYNCYVLSTVMHKPFLNMNDENIAFHRNIFNDYSKKLAMESTLNGVFTDEIIGGRDTYKNKKDLELLMAVALNMRNYTNQGKEKVLIAINSMQGKESLYSFRLAMHIIFLTVMIEFEDKIPMPDNMLGLQPIGLSKKFIELIEHDVHNLKIDNRIEVGNLSSSYKNRFETCLQLGGKIDEILKDRYIN